MGYRHYELHWLLLWTLVPYAATDPAIEPSALGRTTTGTTEQPALALDRHKRRPLTSQWKNKSLLCATTSQAIPSMSYQCAVYRNGYEIRESYAGGTSTPNSGSQLQPTAMLAKPLTTERACDANGEVPTGSLNATQTTIRRLSRKQHVRATPLPSTSRDRYSRWPATSQREHPSRSSFLKHPVAQRDGSHGCHLSQPARPQADKSRYEPSVPLSMAAQFQAPNAEQHELNCMLLHEAPRLDYELKLPSEFGLRNSHETGRAPLTKADFHDAAHKSPRLDLKNPKDISVGKAAVQRLVRIGPFDDICTPINPSGAARGPYLAHAPSRP